MGKPPQFSRLFLQGILALRAFPMMKQLPRRGLPQIDIRQTAQVPLLILLFIKHVFLLHANANAGGYLFFLCQRREHVGNDDRDLLDIVASEGKTNGEVGLHAKTLHAKGESPSAEVQGNDAKGRAPAILIPPPPSRQSAFC